MAFRLPVVMVHTPPASAGAAQLAETIVGELIGMAEIDLTLVGQLTGISTESTDMLSLESLSGDIAALDWQPAAGIVAALGELGFDAARAPHPHDPEASAAEPARRIYAFDLNQFSDARSVCEALSHLKTQRQVRTFSLSPVARPKAASATPSAAKLTTPDRPKNAEKPEAGVPAEESPVLRPDGGSRDPRPAARPPAALDLDDLLDRLDELDP